MTEAMSGAVLEKVKHTDLYWGIREKARENHETPAGTNYTITRLRGFEDVVEHGLGTGLFYNTEMSVSQLIVALSIAPNPGIGEIVRRSDDGSRGLVRALRERQALAGFKVLDLGCGMVPGLALAAKALGAEVYTADGEQLDEETAGRLDGHAVLDLCAPDAPEIVEETTGGEFDYVTNCVIGNVPGHPNWFRPGTGIIRGFGERLLRQGGHHYDLDDPDAPLLRRAA